MTPETVLPLHDNQVAVPVAERSAQSERVYRTLWRWHFYAGLIVAPLLIWASVTGAIYVFVDDIEPWLYRTSLLVEPAGQRISLEDQTAIVQQAFPDEQVDSLAVLKDPARTTEFFLHSKSGPARLVYVDPYRGTVTGSRLFQDGFFAIVRTLHRNLFLGMTGRVMMECGTGWGILLIVTGLAIWWPGFRKGHQQRWKGIWWVRTHSGTRLLLRDLHAVGGAVLSPVITVILVTGLFFTVCWGQGYLVTMFATGGVPPLFVMPTHSKLPTETPRLTIDEVCQLAERRDSGSDPVSISLPHGPEGIYQVHLGTSHAPLRKVMYAVDQYSGEVFHRTDRTNVSAMALLLSFAYPLHVGSIFGLPTKLLAVLACSMIIILCVTGVWMWWRARPTGKTGLPRRADFSRIQRGPVLLMVCCSILMPVAGLSLLTVLLADLLFQRTFVKNNVAK